MDSTTDPQKHLSLRNTTGRDEGEGCCISGAAEDGVQAGQRAQQWLSCHQMYQLQKECLRMQLMLRSPPPNINTTPHDTPQTQYAILLCLSPEQTLSMTTSCALPSAAKRSYCTRAACTSNLRAAISGIVGRQTTCAYAGALMLLSNQTQSQLKQKLPSQRKCR